MTIPVRRDDLRARWAHHRALAARRDSATTDQERDCWCWQLVLQLEHRIPKRHGDDCASEVRIALYRASLRWDAHRAPWDAFASRAIDGAVARWVYQDRAKGLTPRYSCEKGDLNPEFVTPVDGDHLADLIDDQLGGTDPNALGDALDARAVIARITDPLERETIALWADGELSGLWDTIVEEILDRATRN